MNNIDAMEIGNTMNNNSEATGRQVPNPQNLIEGYLNRLGFFTGKIPLSCTVKG